MSTLWYTLKLPQTPRFGALGHTVQGPKFLDNASRVLGFEVLVVGATFEKSPQAVH